MDAREKPLLWLVEEISSPPLSTSGRVETGMLLRRLQLGERLGMPVSRPMPAVGPRCHELRVRDRDANWRIFYHLAPDAIVILAVVKKQSAKTSMRTIEVARSRLQRFLSVT